METLDIGILYISLHNYLLKKTDRQRIITRKRFYGLLGQHFLIQKNLRVVIIKEMEQRGLLEQVSHDKIKINDVRIDLDKEAHKLYDMMGLY